MTSSHEHFMSLALREAENAYNADEVPIGCVITHSDIIIARGYNQTQTLNDPTAHAEMIAMTSAFSYLNSKILKDCTMYVTIEPCAMCAGATRWAQLGKLVYGGHEDKCGYSLFSPNILHPQTEVSNGIHSDSCIKLLQDFFMEKRS